MPLGHYKGTRGNQGQFFSNADIDKCTKVPQSRKESLALFVQYFRYSLGIHHMSCFCFVETTEPTDSLRNVGIYLQKYKEIQTDGVTEEFRDTSCE